MSEEKKIPPEALWGEPGFSSPRKIMSYCNRDMLFTDNLVAMEVRRRGSNRRIALVLYNLIIQDGGDTTIEQLEQDWQLSKDDLYLVRREIKRGWREGRWLDRRNDVRDRREQPDYEKIFGELEKELTENRDGGYIDAVYDTIEKIKKILNG